MGPVVAAVVTAVATIALWYVTRVLAIETRRMALATNAPHVVATIEPNIWSLNHFDIHVSNSGNGTAYDVTLTFDPPLPHKTPRSPEQRPAPLQRLSALRPGQRLTSYLSEFEPLRGSRFDVTITWRRDPSSPVETNRYTIDMADFDAFNSLGERDPFVSIAHDMKKVREKVQSWRDR